MKIPANVTGSSHGRVTDDLRHLESPPKEAAHYQAQRSVPPYRAQLHAASRAIEQRNVDPNGARAECIFMAMEIDMSYASFSKHFARACPRGII
jgi:hypothetical protein